MTDIIPIPADSTVDLQKMTSTVDDTVWVRASVRGRDDIYAESDRVPRRELTREGSSLAEEAFSRLRAKVHPA